MMYKLENVLNELLSFRVYVFTVLTMQGSGVDNGRL